MKINSLTTLHTPSRQEGAVLILSLILLVVLTMLGISAVEMTKLETRMAGNTATQNLVFQNTEAGIVGLEENINDFYDEITEDDFTYNPGSLSPIQITNKIGEVIYRTDMGIKKVVQTEQKSTDELWRYFHTRSISSIPSDQGDTLVKVIEVGMRIAAPDLGLAITGDSET